jgi:Na+-driven multidrug efflux pump
MVQATLKPKSAQYHRFWVLQIPKAYILAVKLDWKQTGVFWAVVISESILAILTILYFKTGRWKKSTLDF